MTVAELISPRKTPLGNIFMMMVTVKFLSFSKMSSFTILISNEVTVVPGLNTARYLSPT